MISTSNIYIDTISSNLIFDYTFTDPISGILDIGLLNFDLNQDYAHDLRRYGQIYGTTTIGTIHVKPMIFFNSNDYPPTVYTNLAYEFIHASNDYKLYYEDTKYVQVNQLYKSESISNIEMDSNISTFLLENSNLILFNTISGTEHNVFRFLNTDIDPKPIEYYCIGSNNSNILMQTDPIDNNISELTKCEYLETFCHDVNIDINKISLITNDECSILYTDTSVYGIGKNEFNIFGLSNSSDGLYDTITSEFVESYQMSNLLSEQSSTIRKLVLNDKSLLAYLNTNKVYGLGSNEMFRYITKSNIEVEPTLSNITELEVLNNFITERDFEFLRIEGGKEHFKFMVAPKRFEIVGGGGTFQGSSTSVSVYSEPFKTERALVLRGDEEWWGIGHNIHNCMCVGELYTNNVFTRMIRLRDLESLIHGINFDPAYTGIILVEPRKYHVFSHNGGILSTSTFVLDIVNKNVYMMGAVDDEEIYTKWIQWLEESDYTQNKYPYYFTQTNHGIYIGYNTEEQTYKTINDL